MVWSGDAVNTSVFHPFSGRNNQVYFGKVRGDTRTSSSIDLHYLDIKKSSGPLFMTRITYGRRRRRRRRRSFSIVVPASTDVSLANSLLTTGILVLGGKRHESNDYSPSRSLPIWTKFSFLWAGEGGFWFEQTKEPEKKRSHIESAKPRYWIKLPTKDYSGLSTVMLKIGGANSTSSARNVGMG